MLLAGASAGLLGLAHAAPVEIASAPLYVGGFVPGNLSLVPSVEYPTIISRANLGGYSLSAIYAGYFDSGKCYKYVKGSSPAEEYFSPVSFLDKGQCKGKGEWSGHFLNWAATQTIDPFRSALTGGYRVKDVAGETWLEKAWHNRSDLYPDLTASAAGVTPYNWKNISIRIANLGNRMRFTGTGSLGGSSNASYSDSATLDPSKVYEVYVRVKVCVPGLLEDNCKQYGSGWKPEGLIQQYSDSLRYSIFGYLNDSNAMRDGGVMRARKKFVGPKKLNPETQLWEDNAAFEWDTQSGVLRRNPDWQDAANTPAGILDSGVINYLNKFGQMTSGAHKSFDPVSELYYVALRYFKNQGNVSDYSSLSGSGAQKYALADGFPVISNWDDPIQYWCQSNVILGIGDVNSHRDKNLPGNKDTNGEPAMPAEVRSDGTVNVVSSTVKVGLLEGVSTKTPFNGNYNSAYMAGLAYDAHTVDMRPDLAGRQTLSTYWVDVRENGVLKPRAQNQYWLAAKYGGFRVPEGFQPYAGTTVSIADALWHTSGEVLSSGDKRPDNFFVASDARRMIDSLTKAFARIAAERTSSASALTASGSEVGNGVTVFQTSFSSSNWSGDLTAYAIDPATQRPDVAPLWSAAAKVPAPGLRKIFVGRNGSLASFTPETVGALDASLVNYLRGDRSQEQPAGVYRTRGGVLGDLVNSAPVYVGSPAPGRYPRDAGYASFASHNRSRTPVVYVGGNDGMLHGFDADTGVETFAFVPDAVLPSLADYAMPGYSHRYFVDGELTVADVYLDDEWKTVLVGTLGRGGRAVYALDVTDPANVKLLWQKGSGDIPSLGQVIGKPLIARMERGHWQVVVGNGLNGSTGEASLLLLDLEDGDVTVVATPASGGNGLSAVDVWDTDGDGYHDTAYGGDQAGNIWAFTSLDKNKPRARLLFSAKDGLGNPQPVTAAPIAAIDPKSRKRWVFFGTGRFLGEGDLRSKQVQTWYGLIDDGTVIGGRGLLAERKIKEDALLAGRMVRVLAKADPSDLLSKKGWFMDLKGSGVKIGGERMVVPNQIRGASLVGTSRIPDASDPCLPDGRGFSMAINPFTGTALERGFFDVDGDGKVDENDMLGGSYVSGVGFDSSPSAPIFVGNNMLSSLENASLAQLVTSGGFGLAKRMSWREIVGD
ncbi:hypothetical protein E5K04_13740 [Crenobacter intestini]|uniref:PilY1 beta-propeller domain-containing protein n=2 Tax=Crenobacter intestini TaxID=2563443 RepID=A0A4T0UMV4_9NEIS|nr:hypothetical protein E5K04_13740 [Crenobacter intestini]